ncbi:hypothetical protein MPSEU_000825700 [Mayamaea pseudoterrestris]|nr:hypothetical protein MPSEU_000825700 [Mayamaea pseudoterrestris]
MVAHRDPFPMQSDAAKALSATSGDASNIIHQWTSMDTSSNEPSNTIIEASDAQDGLTGTKKKKSADDDSDDENNDDEDEFLDRPIWESRSPSERAIAKVQRVLEKVYQRLYGDKLPISEMIRTLCLASTLYFMIGGYWIMRSLKDPILTSICGVGVIPKAKMLSVVLVLGVVSIYNRLLDTKIPRHQLFYIFGTFYFFLFMTIALLLMHPTIGLANQRQSPWRLLGWATYCTIESYGSIMVSLFWSFTNSNFSLESAKASYGVLIACAQVGSILGPTFVNQYAETLGVTTCYIIGAFCLTSLQATMYMYVSIYGAMDHTAVAASPTKTLSKERTGIFEGVRLFWKYNYVKGIFAISCVFMIVGTIIDYIMKTLARDYFAEKHVCEIGMSCYDTTGGEHGMSEDATAAFTSFMGLFGQSANTISFLFSLLGTSAVIRTLGLRWTLLLFPSLCLTVITIVRFYPTLNVTFGAMMAIKAASYSLNNPTKEILYQPTSSSVKYKAKSWIDIFGARGAKATASLVTNAFSYSTAVLVQNGSLVGMCVASFLIWNATYMGKKFDEYTESGYIVGDENSPDEDGGDGNYLEMSTDSHEGDTSCVIYDDDELDDLEAEI